MPIQAPQWSDYLNCPVCCREFGAPPRSPISLSCGHTLCKHCILNLLRKQCPFDQVVIQGEPDEMVVNTALLQLAGIQPPAKPYRPPAIQTLRKQDQMAYDIIVQSLEQLAMYLKIFSSNTVGCSRLSKPMQRKLIMLLQCAITDEEGRSKAVRAARSLGERTVTELLLQHQNPQLLSGNLWAAVRARGCQFLGPAMQEEVLKLILLALEDGSALSRKVLVMFVVQSLERHFPHASKTSIGHVVQLLYRASCFKLSKRESDSSLMQLKDEFRTYEALRREHDAQIVQIATEAGLRIAPDQWSALLYGDTGHKSHMQSIIDKLQSPESFAMSVGELYIALQRTGDPAHLIVISKHLHRLANIDPSPDARCPTWQELGNIITAIKEVITGLLYYLQLQANSREANQKLATQDRLTEYPALCQPTSQASGTTQPQTSYMCPDSNNRTYCPRGITRIFGHITDIVESNEMEPPGGQTACGNQQYMGALSIMPPPPPPPPLLMPLPHPPMMRSLPPPTQLAMPPQPPMSMPLYPRYSLPPPPLPTPSNTPHPQHMQNHGPPSHQLSHLHVETYSGPPVQLLPQSVSQDVLPSPENALNNNAQPGSYTSPIMHNQVPVVMNGNNMNVAVPQRPYYGQYAGVMPMSDERPNNVQYPRPEYVCPVYQGPSSVGGPGPDHQTSKQNMPPQMPNMFVPMQHDPAQYAFDDRFDSISPHDRALDPSWPSSSHIFTYGNMRNPLPQCSAPSDDIFNFDAMRNALPKGPAPTDEIFTFDTIRNGLPQCPVSSDELFNVTGDRRTVGADRHPEMLAATTADLNNCADDHELEEELQALERRIDTEFKNTD